MYMYNLLETGIYEIDTLISKLEKLEIIGENPTKHWEKDKYYYKLEILNLNLKITSQKLDYSNLEMEEFEMHIGDLRKLGIIRKSEAHIGVRHLL